MNAQLLTDLFQDAAIVVLVVGGIFQARAIRNLTKVQAIWDLIDASEGDEP